MVKEITEIDMNKYLVLKWEDIQNCPIEVKERLAFVQGAIEAHRHGKGKPDNEYLVLNMDDKISVLHLINKLSASNWSSNSKIKDIAVNIVNAILKAKGG